MMQYRIAARAAAGAAASAALAALLASCGSPSRAPAAPPGPIQVEPALPPAAVPGAISRSDARSARAYRHDAAAHIYDLNRQRIWKGHLPPLLYAVGVLQVEVDGRGNVRHLNWMRAPRHAPEVVREIERTVRAASPFPVPAHLGANAVFNQAEVDEYGNIKAITSQQSDVPRT